MGALLPAYSPYFQSREARMMGVTAGIQSQLTMLIDLYQLTMAEGYWKLNKHEIPAVFALFFRTLPFGGGFAIACGLQAVIEAVSNFKFEQNDCEYLANLKTANGQALFDHSFLEALQKLKLTVDIFGIPEGTVVFSKEPLLRVQGPLWQCQLLETLLLNLINFPTLIATKAARVCLAAKGEPVIEFGLRRAQGIDGGLTASRAAYVGGVTSSSNVLAGFKYGIPIAGTHAHSWVMAFEDELEAFLAYAQVSPHNVILLVDTYDTINGIKNAIQVGKKLKNKGSQLLGIRLDSGNLAELSIKARQMLDEVGLKETKIVGSGDLDEYTIDQLKKEGAKIDIWGVGTRLVTGYDQPALGGVYKLMAIKGVDGKWQYKAKTTDDPHKKTIGGIHGVRRFSVENTFTRDVLYNLEKASPEPQENETVEDLLELIFHQGKLVYTPPKLSDIQLHTQSQLDKLPMALKQLKPEIQYIVVTPRPSPRKGGG